MGGPATYTSIDNQEHRNSGFSSEYRFFVEGESSIYSGQDLTFLQTFFLAQKNDGQREVFTYSFFFFTHDRIQAKCSMYTFFSVDAFLTSRGKGTGPSYFHLPPQEHVSVCLHACMTARRRHVT